MTENVGTDVATVTDAEGTREAALTVGEKLANINSGAVGVFTTIQGDDFAAKAQVLAAITDAEPLSEHLGETINLANIVAQAVEVADDQTGELSQAIRVILLDDEGNAYAGLSEGLFRSIQNIVAILGQPHTWPHPYPMKVVEKRSRRGFRFYSIVPA